MKKVWITVLGILSIIFCVFLIVLYFYFVTFIGWSSSLRGFLWGLPLAAGAILALFGGINTFKGKAWRWRSAGFICAVAGWVYFYIFAWMSVWGV